MMPRHLRVQPPTDRHCYSCALSHRHPSTLNIHSSVKDNYQLVNRCDDFRLIKLQARLKLKCTGLIYNCLIYGYRGAQKNGTIFSVRLNITKY